MGKGSSSQPTEQTVTQTSIPEYAEPFVMNVMSTAEGIANQGYTPYGGPRIAAFGQDQLNAFDQTRNMQGMTDPSYNTGQGLTGIAALQAAGSGYNPNTLTNNHNATAFDGGQWNQQAAQQYMSPYMTQVLDQVMARQQRNFDQGQVARNAQAKQSGAFGGYRFGVQDAVARSMHEMNVGDLMAQNLNQGYNTAFQQFASDQSRGLQAGQMTEQANQFGTDLGFRRDQTNNQNQLDASRMGLSQAQMLGQLGSQTAQMGVNQQNATLQGIDALRSVGLDQQRQSQASLDQAYNDFVNQRDHQRNQIGWLNNIIRGNVVGANSNTVSTESVNPYTQMLGLGIGGIGLANALGGMGGSNSVVGPGGGG